MPREVRVCFLPPSTELSFGFGDRFWGSFGYAGQHLVGFGAEPKGGYRPKKRRGVIFGSSSEGALIVQAVYVCFKPVNKAHMGVGMAF